VPPPSLPLSSSSTVGPVPEVGTLNLAANLLITGALLQRATTVDVATRSRPVKLALNLVPELPTGFSGSATIDSLRNSDDANQVILDWREETPINLDIQRCNGQTVTVTCVGHSLTSITYLPHKCLGPWRYEVELYLSDVEYNQCYDV